jgi:inner membrane protein
MTRGTHQIGAFAAGLGALALLGPGTIQALVTSPPLSALGLTPPAAPVGWPSALAFFVGALIGGTAPDLDKQRGFWAGLLARTAFGGHRHLSHSLVGMVLMAVLAALVFRALGLVFGLASSLPFLGFVAGYASHLVLDSLTREGVPWLFPLPTYFGFPPLSSLRVRTGNLVEQFVVAPALLTLIGWIGYREGSALLSWLH